MKEKPYDDYWHEEFQRYANLDIPDYEKSLYFKKDSDMRLKLFLKVLKQVEFKNLLMLDAGCGSGFFSKALLKDGIRIIGIDKSNNILKVAKKNDAENKMTFMCGDLYNLPFKDECFDMTFSIGVLQHISDYQKMVNEFCRVTRKILIVDTLRQPFDNKFLQYIELLNILLYRFFFSKDLSKDTKKRIQIIKNKSYFSEECFKNGEYIEVARYQVEDIAKILRNYNFHYFKPYYINIVSNLSLMSGEFFLFAKKTD